jgi:hypothetical protein
MESGHSVYENVLLRKHSEFPNYWPREVENPEGPPPLQPLEFRWKWDVNWWWVLETWIEMWTGDEFLRLGLRCELVMSSWDLDWDVNWWLVLETWIEMWTGDEFLRHGLSCELLMSFIITHNSLTQNIWYIWKMWQNIFAFGIRSIKNGAGGGGEWWELKLEVGQLELPSFERDQICLAS